MFKIPRFRFHRGWRTRFAASLRTILGWDGQTEKNKRPAQSFIAKIKSDSDSTYSGCKIVKCDVTSKYRACKSGWSSAFVSACLMCALLLTNKYCPFMMLFTGAIPVARQQFRHDKFWGLINARATGVHWVRLGIMGISWVISELSVNTNVFLSSEYHPPNTRVITLVWRE